MADFVATKPRVAVVTGGSKGLGRELLDSLVAEDWTVVTDARDVTSLPQASGIVALAGDITNQAHRTDLIEAARAAGPVGLVIANASRLGPSPLRRVEALETDELTAIFATNVVASLALVQALLPDLRAQRGVFVAVSSDAAVEPYAGWAGYAASKAALDQLTAVLAVEEPAIAAYSFDPGDMRTDMHQAAFPGEDISDRPEPSTVAPILLRMIRERPASGRYVGSSLAESTAGVTR